MKILLKNADILDATYNYEKKDVLIEGEYIVQIGERLSIPKEDCQVLEMGGMTLMPAFVDAHMHVKPRSGPFKDDTIKALAYNGVSAVKDLGILDSIPLQVYMDWLKKQDQPGKVRVSTAGRYIEVDHGYGMGPVPGVKWGIEITSPEEAARAVVDQFRLGVKGIKIGLREGAPASQKLTAEEIKAITAQAKKLGIWTTAHVHTVEDLKNAVSCGIGESAHTPLDAIIDDETMDLMVKKGIPMTTTIGNINGSDPLPERFPPEFKSAQEFLDSALRKQDIMLRNLEKFYHAGGTINVGTDNMFLEDPLHQATIPVVELRHLYHDVGMPLKETIIAGTVNAAVSAGFSDEGAIRLGNRASVIAFKGKLDYNFDKLLNLPFVMNRGVVLRNEI